LSTDTSGDWGLVAATSQATSEGGHLVNGLDHGCPLGHPCSVLMSTGDEKTSARRVTAIKSLRDDNIFGTSPLPVLEQIIKERGIYVDFTYS
jgi:hypothetical protein